MATASVVLKLDPTFPKDVTERTVKYRGSATVDAGPDVYAAGGLTLNFAIDGVSANAAPLEIRVWSESTAATGYLYKGVPGAKISDGLLLIYEGAAGPIAEIAAAAIPAGVSGDTIKFEATFAKGW